MLSIQLVSSHSDRSIYFLCREFTQEKSRRQHREAGSDAKGEDNNRYEDRVVSLPHSSKDQFKPGGASSSKVKLDNHNTKEDPLAEFYPLARAERDINVSSDLPYLIIRTLIKM